MRKKSEAEETKQIRTLAIALVVLISAFTAIRYGLRGMPEGIPLLMIAVGASVIVLLISLAKPSILRPAFKYWMIGARAIGWFNARLLLSVMFFIMFTPIAFLMRLFGRHTVDRSSRRIAKPTG
ncbi:hypothetical protein J7M28_06010 [bacterium]|nr:hypothetical protein [bacterium]